MAVAERTAAPRRQAPAVDPAELDRMSRDAIAASALFGPANVVMQLALRPVGRGVAESTVDSGRVDKHPFKRQRTTASYLIVALLGTDEERRVMRSEVNRQHRQVRRREGEAEVPYNAFAKDLQLWVAGCIYVGFSYWLELARGPLTEAQRDAFYHHCAKLGTTLQVPEQDWPADREAFAAYFAEAMGRLEMDDVTRGYLQDLANLRLVENRLGPVGRALSRGHRFLVVGFLAPEFRALLQEPWSADDQRRFDRFLRRAIRVDRATPAAIRHALLNVYEWDVKRRIANDRAIV